MGKLRDFTSENLENNCVYTFQYIYILVYEHWGKCWFQPKNIGIFGNFTGENYGENRELSLLMGKPWDLTYGHNGIG
jgi:hypothetical protein